jgi:hypothetical protein
MGIRRAALAAALLVIVGSAACNGDDDDSSTGTDSSITDGGTADENPVPADLSDILGRQADAVIRVSYQRGADTFTIAQDHDTRAIVTDRSMSIVTSERTIDCSNLDTQPTCLEVPEGVSSLVNLALSFYNVVTQSLASAADSIPASAMTETEVAGRPAVCAEGEAATFLSELTDTFGSVPPGTVRVCVDVATGYLLEYTNAADAADDLVATEVGEPSDADFEPPAEVDELAPA